MKYFFFPNIFPWIKTLFCLELIYRKKKDFAFRPFKIAADQSASSCRQIFGSWEIQIMWNLQKNIMCREKHDLIIFFFFYKCIKHVFASTMSSSKRQFMETLSSKKKMFRPEWSVKRSQETVFWGMKESISSDFLEKGVIINHAPYWQFLQQHFPLSIKWLLYKKRTYFFNCNFFQTAVELDNK